MTEARWSDERVSARLAPDPQGVAPLQLTTSGRGHLTAFRDPLPKSLSARAPAEERERHEAVARRHADVAARVRELGVELKRARAADEAAAVDAAASGEPMPEPRAPSLEAELEQTRRELGALEHALPRSANDLLATVAGEVPAAIAEARERGRAVIAGIDEVLASLEPELAEAAAAFAEVAWLARLLEQRALAPYAQGRGGRELRGIGGALAEIRGRLAEVLEREQEPAPLTSDDSMMWHPSHRVRRRVEREQAGEEEAR
jgi:hypothetical protein